MNEEPKQNEMPQKPVSKTAHELVIEHINNPGKTITDEGIQDSETHLGDESEQLTTKQKEEADNLADEIKKDNTGMSYTAEL